MGLLGRLFGKSDEKDTAADRCNECGMEGGRHTEWCPLVAAEPQDDRDDRPRETAGGGGGPGQGA